MIIIFFICSFLLLLSPVVFDGFLAGYFAGFGSLMLVISFISLTVKKYLPSKASQLHSNLSKSIPSGKISSKRGK